MKKNLLVFALITVTIVSACKKNNPAPPPGGGTDNPAAGSRLGKIKDSIFYHAKESYLWNDALPSYDVFKPRNFTGSTEIAGLQKEIDAISQYKLNPSTGKPYEYYAPQPGTSKYSFIDDGSVSGELGGVAGDYGMEPRYGFDDNLYIKYVYPNSPADEAGIKRGYRVVELNGQTDFDPDVDANIDGLIEGFYVEDDMDITLQRPDGTTFSTSLTVSEYTINPVITYKVIPLGAKKAGYIVFNSFTAMANAKPKLDEAFTHFKSNGVTDLVVDLRYNGGGYSNTSDYLANLIVPAGKNGSLMSTDVTNENLQTGKFPLLNKAVFDNELPLDFFKLENTRTLFNKQGTLNPNKVVFIVTGSTASASESVINNLLPHMDVQIVGEPTYGKPVGFYGIPIDKYDVYLVQIAGRNSLNKSDFYQGMLPGSSEFPGKLMGEDVSKDFGDLEESSLATALSYISTGSFLSVAPSKKLAGKSVRSLSQMRDLGLKLDKPRRFRGMILNGPK